VKHRLGEQQKLIMTLEHELRDVINYHRGTGVMRISVIGLLDLLKQELLVEVLEQ
jgi:hypothetical protein